MEEKHKKELDKAMDLIKLSMNETDSKKVFFLLKEAHGIFMNVWTAYMEYMFSDKKY